MNKNKVAIKLRCKRWIDILVLTIVSAIITAYIQRPIIDNISACIENTCARWHSVFAFLVYLTIITSIICCLKTSGGFRWKDLDLKRSCFNPPAWYASILTICLMPICSYYFDTGILDKDLIWYNAIIWGVIFLPLTIFGLLLAIFRWLLTILGRPGKQVDGLPQHNQSHNDKNNLESMSKNPDLLIEWLKKESPIEATEDDLFDAVPIANRIARSMLSDPPKNISLIGNYGSGKTSVLNMVSKLLEQKNVIVIPISTWAFQDGSFVDYILKHIIQKVSQETDCISTVLIPLKYQNALQQLDLGMFSFIKLFLSLETPEELIEKVNNILVMADKKVAVFIEDVDRNNSPGFTGEVYSLFNYFSGQSKISFVITHGGVI
jgi:hypothetical protein